MTNIHNAQARSRLLALLLEQEGLDGGEVVSAHPVRQTYPVSFAQQRIWFMTQLTPDTIAYNVPGAFRITGALHHEALARSFRELLRRHAILRTLFSYEQEQIIQTVSPFTPLLFHTLPLIDLSALPLQTREETAYRLARAEAQRPFRLSEDWPMRVQLLRLNANTHIVLLMLHHIAVDDWSSALLLRELDVLYSAFSQGQPSPLPEVAFQYGDYALRQQEQANSEELQRQLAYWRVQLADVPVLELPTDFPRPAVETFQGATYQFVFTGPLLAQLKLLSQREGVTLFMALLTAFQILLMQYSGQQDVVVGTPTASRTSIELERLIGCIVNTLVLRTNFAGDPSFLQALQRVREVALDAYAHQDVPFERLVEVLRPRRSPGRNPLHQVLFQLRNAPREMHGLGELEIAPVALHMTTTKFDLSLDLIDSSGELAGRLTYNTDLFAERSMHILIERFRSLLEKIVEEPIQHIRQFSVYPDAYHIIKEPLAIRNSSLPPISSAIQTAPGHKEKSAGDAQSLPPTRSSIGEITQVEQTIRSIWQELLRRQEIGPDDNFFDLGGHSLQLLRMQNRLKEQLRQEIPVLEIFKYPTIKSLARYFSGQIDAEVEDTAVKKQLRASARRASLQKRMLLQTNKEQGE